MLCGKMLEQTYTSGKAKNILQFEYLLILNEEIKRGGDVMWFACPDEVRFPGCFSVQQEINKVCVSLIAIDLPRPQQKMLDILDRLSLFEIIDPSRTLSYK